MRFVVVIPVAFFSRLREKKKLCCIYRERGNFFARRVSQTYISSAIESKLLRANTYIISVKRGPNDTSKQNNNGSKTSDRENSQSRGGGIVIYAVFARGVLGCLWFFRRDGLRDNRFRRGGGVRPGFVQTRVLGERYRRDDGGGGDRGDRGGEFSVRAERRHRYDI